ncbi:MAG: beta-ketoacyl-[acyl-carrier-protein] synthase II [Omnitrophica bacterium RIFCSPLOWO2_12_FULL_44_17]|uniref:3-oxoacyl-[acyl-carrier-protein] synthase 2 n=1 Tax=Candidatus Danuiimicrobium aquiferis TaxID=1801832 RepID=A0A1G1KYI5_9BACT|nr:MAG: beta-ketoacyl-[acyl-carrier-protein] synthase II [Omnitrophica bacterium RIFCSPHIGHO2_02_FULL_45_28]OGW90236.1 MAG: beta-ketoacyl-[acyl-carrier-protein] synthase II [Omnitrophica bacterium RIFCSPHIGHO2_12_FULL_44_12]OGW97977.1 MAG: beta-ketoacyl-[acyl-carrier-protein] synthase II [Omnitrophica bacterium RIFCSPLOWO2_12_FULL_44_17]OGX03579.1 MAG: beta-ketoacyl-[acyl-carrier-protein] synthase II [Omnitrophica bacterium RIFCSPLOWO2_02_FULL_44_11]
MKHRVVITGAGCVTPVGNTVKESWEAIISGRSGTGRVTQVNPDLYSSKVAAEVKGFDPAQFIPDKKQIKKNDRFVQFAIAASQMAVADAQIDLSKEDLYRIGVLIGSGIGGLRVIEEQHKVLMERGPERISPFLIPMLIVNMAPGQVAIQLGLKGPNSCVATACATGSHALGDACRIIQRGEADVMLSGGTESCITPLGFAGFDNMKALSTLNDVPERASRPFDKTRNGFVMGEGCGIVILERLERALKRNAKIYCELVGYGMTADATHMTAPDPNGFGAQRCMEIAMEDAGIKPEDVDYINAHGTSTQLNDKVESLAIKKALTEPIAKKVMVSSTKSMTGHLLGAGGAVEAIFTAHAIKYGIVPPTINYEFPDPDCDLDYVPNQARQKNIRVALSNSLGFGGHNVTLCFKKFEG